MTKRRILLKIEIFVLIFAVILGSVTFVMNEKTNNPPTISTFYKEPNNSLDVVFLGSSHMLHAAYPMQLYNDFGIASHNYSQYGQPFYLTYESFKEILKYQKPKIAVIDIMTISWLFEPNWQSALHNIIDAIPFSLSKFFFINNFFYDSIDSKNNVNLFNSYFPIYLYHSKWNILQKKDFSLIKNYSKGVTWGYNNFSGNKPNILSISNRLTLNDEMRENLDKIIKVAKKENISLIFTVIPYDKSYMNIEKAQKYYNEVYWLTKSEKNIEYLNYFHNLDEINFNFTYDLIDDDHLNYYGAQKITAHLGKYIKEHYDIPDRRLDPAYAKWNDDYKLYVQDTFAQELNATKNSEKYLELLTSKKEATDNTCIFVVKTSEKNINSKHFNSLGINVNTNNCITIIDEGKVVYNRVASDVPLQHEYKLGRIPIKLVSDVKGKTSSIKIDGIEQIKNKSGITVVIYDKLLKKVSSVRSL